MSGQQIGSVVGGVIGAFFGMPALGAAIGGMIGGWIDPTQVNGPRIGDGASQTSQEGQPIAWVIGTCGWLQGNIVDNSPRRPVKKTDDGKGSGTEVNTWEAHQDFVLMICESSEHRESLMVGPLIIKVDGKIVYDMRPDKNFGAENAKFLKNHTFYNGNESQMPDPTCEAFPHNGVGNTPYYRGVFTMVARDINLTAYGDRIPLYEFVMVGAGDEVAGEVTSLVVPTYSRFTNSDWPLADPERAYTYTGYYQTASVGTVQNFQADTIAEIIAHFEAIGFDGAPTQLGEYLGYSCSTSTSTGGLSYNRATAQLDVTDNQYVLLIYNARIPADYYASTDGCALLPYASPGLPAWHGMGEGQIARIQKGDIPLAPGETSFNNCVGYPAEGGIFPRSVGFHPLIIRVQRRVSPPEGILGDPCLLGFPTIIPGSPGFTQDCQGIVAPALTYAASAATGAKVLQAEQIAVVSGRHVYVKYLVGPALASGDPLGTQAFWEAAYDAAVAGGRMPAGLSYPSDYPVTVGSGVLYEGSYATTDLTQDTVGLDTSIARICKRGGLTVGDIDVSEMDQQLLGYMITQAYNGADCIRPLMTAFTSYGSEYDGKLRFHKHGEDIEVVVNPDDFIAGSDETDKNTREQEIEYPRLLSVTAIDPTQDYTARPQVERRITPDIRAIGEEQMQVPIVMTPDSQRQLAAIGMKVSWARAQGKREFSVPYATSTGLYLYLVAGKPFALEGKRYIAQNVRLEDGEIHFEAVYDRQSAYTSDVTATPALPPTVPPSTIGGVTLFAAMNLPTLRPQDAVSGMYIAVDGLLDSWPGCALQMSIDDEATWTTAIGSMTQASVMGYLTAPIDDQPTSTLSVSVHGGTLDSITDARLADGGNASAVITNGVSELLQFKTATETDPDKYDLTDLVRGGLGTTAAAHTQGDRFVELSSVYFLPLDASLAGRTIKFRPVTFGTPPESNAVYSVVFEPPTFIIDGGEVT